MLTTVREQSPAGTDSAAPCVMTGAASAELAATAAKLQGTLEEFGLSSRVEGWIAGPSVTTFKISMGEGERVNKIVNLEDDIALSLAAKSVRIFAPIPGTSLVGIEIPNEKPQPVFLSDVLPYAKGGPLDSTRSITYFTYDQFGFGNYGYAAAASYLLFLAVVLLTWAQFRWLGEREAKR